MEWIAPSEKNPATDTLEKRLWSSTDQFRANSSLSAAQYSQPVMGLIFLRFAQPPRALLDRFCAIVAPGFRPFYKLHLQIQDLRRTSDLLLPRLLSGRVNLTES